MKSVDLPKTVSLSEEGLIQQLEAERRKRKLGTHAKTAAQLITERLNELHTGQFIPVVGREAKAAAIPA